jgi:hypothetical protein
MLTCNKSSSILVEYRSNYMESLILYLDLVLEWFFIFKNYNIFKIS